MMLHPGTNIGRRGSIRRISITIVEDTAYVSWHAGWSTRMYYGMRDSILTQQGERKDGNGMVFDRNRSDGGAPGPDRMATAIAEMGHAGTVQPARAASWVSGDGPAPDRRRNHRAGRAGRVGRVAPHWRWLLLQVDGTPGLHPCGMAGIGIVVRTLHGRVLFWQGCQAPAHTNNEAEYQAVIAGLQVMQQHFPGIGVRCLTDSQIVVFQMTGQAAVRAAALQPLHQQATRLVQQIGSVEFLAIPRVLNRLADSLAWEALSGQWQLGKTGRRLHGHGVSKDKE